MKQKILSLFLAMAILLSAVPMTWAAEQEAAYLENAVLLGDGQPSTSFMCEAEDVIVPDQSDIVVRTSAAASGGKYAYMAKAATDMSNANAAQPGQMSFSFIAEKGLMLCGQDCMQPMTIPAYTFPSMAVPIAIPAWWKPCRRRMNLSGTVF